MKIITFVLLSVAIISFHLATIDNSSYTISPSQPIYRGPSIETPFDTMDTESLQDTLIMMRLQQQQFIEEVRENLKEDKPDYTAMLVAITAFFGALLGGIKLLLSVMDRGNKTEFNFIKTKLEENNKQHKEIFTTLKIVEDISTKKAVTDKLKHACEHHIHYSKELLPNEVQILIYGQTKRLIELSQEIMTEQFTLETLTAVETRLGELCVIAWKQVDELLGNGFIDEYKKFQKEHVEQFLYNLKRIVETGAVNSKYERYSAAVEIFLHDMISSTITMWHDNVIKKQKK